MSVAIGFHPYYKLTDSKREDWTISVGARTQWLLAAHKIPTGDEVHRDIFPHPHAVPLKNCDMDHVFGDLVRDSNGRATFSISGKQQKLEIQFGPKYLAAVMNVRILRRLHVGPGGGGGTGAFGAG
jgi:aldose 1-epimerase